MVLIFSIDSTEIPVSISFLNIPFGLSDGDSDLSISAFDVVE